MGLRLIQHEELLAHSLLGTQSPSPIPQKLQRVDQVAELLQEVFHQPTDLT